MKIGAFSISLSVSDLAASQAFYETLGFEVTGGDADENWLIMRHGETTIGLFHGMFDDNRLTFNPGLNQDMSQTDDFTDVRDAQATLRDAGYDVQVPTEAGGDGPAHIIVHDPDGNAVMIDQFFPRPG